MSGDCPDCGRAFSGKGPEPEGPNPDTMTEPGEKKRKKPKEAVHFTEDSPIWESRMGSEFFLLRALRTCWQILRHPQRTFAAPRHSGNSKGIGFLVTCWGTKRVVQLLIVAVISLHAGEAPPIKDILISLVIWPLDALISLVVVAGLLHLGVVLFHRVSQGLRHDGAIRRLCHGRGQYHAVAVLHALSVAWLGRGGGDSLRPAFPQIHRPHSQHDYLLSFVFLSQIRTCDEFGQGNRGARPACRSSCRPICFRLDAITRIPRSFEIPMLREQCHELSCPAESPRRN